MVDLLNLQCKQCGKWSTAGAGYLPSFSQELYCQDCWKLRNEEVLSYPIDQLANQPAPHWLQLLKVPHRPLVRNKGPFPWTDLDIRKIDESLRCSIEQLYADVQNELPSHPGQRCLSEFFTSLAASTEFQMLWAGERRGPFVLPTHFVKNLLTLDDILHGLSAPSVRKPCESALTLTDGADFRCPISLPPIRHMAELLDVLQYGTIFLNTASLHWTVAAELCLAANRAFQFPSNINVYVTGPGRSVSTDVHTDNHDVLVLQSQGAKHWRIFAPPLRMPHSHPLFRGKNDDRLLDSELHEPLLDVVLHPGEVLFVPMGFPHATGTEGTGGTEVSVHFTLGLSTADYDLCLGGLKQSFLQEMGLTKKEEMSGKSWWQLLLPIPVGFLVPEWIRESEAPSQRYIQEIVKQLLEVSAAELLESGKSLGEISECAEQVASKRLMQQVAVLNSQEEAYEEVINSGDRIFFAAGPEQTCSEYRRSMLRHQIAEDERKRCVADASDPRFVRRIDPMDGVARTFSELQRVHALSMAEMDVYWQKCESLYPHDQPPAELLQELQRASETCKDLLYFLHKRTPQLKKTRVQSFASRRLAAREKRAQLAGARTVEDRIRQTGEDRISALFRPALSTVLSLSVREAHCALVACLLRARTERSSVAAGFHSNGLLLTDFPKVSIQCLD